MPWHFKPPITVMPGLAGYFEFRCEQLGYQTSYRITNRTMLHYGSSTSIDISALFDGRKTEFAGLELIKDWLDECKDTHTKCNPVQYKSIPGLRVIDGKRRVIVTARKSCSYVVPSYVWGGSKAHEDLASNVLKKRLPPTIEDSMIVTQ